MTGIGHRLQESHMLVVQAERDTEMYLVGLAFNLVETVVHLGQLGKTWRKPGFHWIQGCV